MKNKEQKKLRSDRPSGRQAADQKQEPPQEPAVESLHQGQGPEFQTQDKHLRKSNPGVKKQARDHPAQRETHQQRKKPPETTARDLKKDY